MLNLKLFFLLILLSFTTTSFADCFTNDKSLDIHSLNGLKINLIQEQPNYYYDTEKLPSSYSFKVKASNKSECRVYSTKTSRTCLMVSVDWTPGELGSRCEVTIYEDMKKLSSFELYMDENEPSGVKKRKSKSSSSSDSKILELLKEMENL